MPAYRPLFLATLLVVAITTLPLPLHASQTPHWVHYRLLLSKSNLPKKVVVLPVNVEVIEVTAGGVEEKVPKWSREASLSVSNALSTAIVKQARLKVVHTPNFSGATLANVDEHLALYKLVVNTASRTTLPHKFRRFDYGIGPGLRALASQTGADAAILVYGRDYVSTAGRKAKAVAGNIPIINIFAGPPPKLGHSFIHVGIVDLRTGDLLWMNSNYREGSTNLRDAGDANKMMQTIFKWYPGIEEYRKVYAK